MGALFSALPLFWCSAQILHLFFLNQFYSFMSFHVITPVCFLRNLLGISCIIAYASNYSLSKPLNKVSIVVQIVSNLSGDSLCTRNKIAVNRACCVSLVLSSNVASNLYVISAPSKSFGETLSALHRLINAGTLGNLAPLSIFLIVPLEHSHNSANFSDVIFA